MDERPVVTKWFVKEAGAGHRYYSAVRMTVQLTVMHKDGRWFFIAERGTDSASLAFRTYSSYHEGITFQYSDLAKRAAEEFVDANINFK